MTLRRWLDSSPLAGKRVSLPSVPARYGVPAIGSFLAACQFLPAGRAVFELIVYLLLLAVALSSRWTRELLGALKPLHRRLIGGFILIMVFGQMYDRSVKIYPFVSWTMYSNATTPSPRLHRIKARLTDGRIVDLPLHPFPIYTLNCATALRRLSDKAADPSAKNPQGACKELADFEKAVALAYERRHPGSTVHSLLLDEAPFDTGAFRGADQLEWRLCYESPPFR